MTSSLTDPHLALVPRTPLIPIFLDFEGVLRANGSTAEGFNMAANLVPPLVEAEALGLDPVLVVASTYRLDFGVEVLAQVLERQAPGLGRFVRGATPSPSELHMNREQQRLHAEAPRIFEVKEWLAREHILESHWIAIDDRADLYGQSPGQSACDPLEQLLLCRGSVGFDAERASELGARLRRIASELGLPAGGPPRSGTSLMSAKSI